MNDTSSRAHTIFTISLEQVRSVVPMRGLFLAAMALSFVLGFSTIAPPCDEGVQSPSCRQTGGGHSWHYTTACVLARALAIASLTRKPALANMQSRFCAEQTSPYRFCAAYRFFF